MLSNKFNESIDNFIILRHSKHGNELNDDNQSLDDLFYGSSNTI